MNEKDFEGTLVLEKLGEIGKVDDFFDAIDSDDMNRVTRLMRNAGVDPADIKMVVKKISEASGE